MRTPDIGAALPETPDLSGLRCECSPATVSTLNVSIVDAAVSGVQIFVRV